MRRLSHPNICQLVETYEDDSFAYMVMEFIAGGDLLERLMQVKTMHDQEAAAIMRCVFSALAYLHDMRVVHRDLKLENILLVEAGDCTDVKLTDWGYASWCPDGERFSRLLGTAFYIAPEVLDGEYGLEADIWST